MIHEAEIAAALTVCAAHVVAWCPACLGSFTLGDLTAARDDHRHVALCPDCGHDISASLAGHLATCPAYRAQSAAAIVKRSRAVIDASEVLIAESAVLEQDSRERMDLVKGGRPSRAKESVYAFITAHTGAAFCVDCLQEAARMSKSVVFSAVLCLEARANVRRAYGTCSKCGRERLVTSRTA